ncbi:MAG: hypothetical protein K2G90_05465 [Muribaculaceae bacterium]|nr:hypothetical protein [Muribaculaceae bacterium]
MMDKTKLNELLDSVYELEGLIYLALNRDDNIPVLCDLIARKGSKIADEAARIHSSAQEFVSEDKYVAEEDEPEVIASFSSEEDEEPEVIAPFGSEDEEPEYVEEPDAPQDEAEIAATVSIPLEKIDSPLEREIISDGIAGAEEKAMEEIVGEIAKESLAKTGPQKARGRLVFTLNDKFRFKKELFRNSEPDFNNTLSYVASLDSYEEAEDYFLTELQWNPEREEVKEFLTILKNYFK